MAQTRERMKKHVRLVVLAVILAGVIGAMLLLPVIPCLADALAYVERSGVWGPVVLGVFYVVCSVFLVPGSIPTLAAGFLFGVALGSLTAILGSTIGACAAFLVGRTMARGWVARRIARSRRFTAMDRMVGRHGFKVVLLSRLSPISPFVVVNYLFSLTKVSFWEYASGSLIGMIPGTVMFVYFGAGLRSLTEVTAFAKGQLPASTTERVFFWAGLAVAVIVVVLLARLAHASLQRAMPKDEEDGNGTGEHGA
jgi:uncharacterized membrane protein YdjX (TVP38/TMEM64 family)